MGWASSIPWSMDFTRRPRWPGFAPRRASSCANGPTRFPGARSVGGAHPAVPPREDPIPSWLPWAESERRYAATRFAEGDASAQDAFEQVVESLPDLQVVVVRQSP